MTRSSTSSHNDVQVTTTTKIFEDSIIIESKRSESTPNLSLPSKINDKIYWLLELLTISVKQTQGTINMYGHIKQKGHYVLFSILSHV